MISWRIKKIKKSSSIGVGKGIHRSSQVTGNFSRFHDKMKKRDKKRDKMFTLIWKGVKGLWKFIREIDPLPLSTLDQSNDVLVHWYEDDDVDDSETTESEKIE
ncbi:hypothetical protein H5410_021737 [Solanum commersonii]|uniref:Uncharacterized protein n=1 Tax=Solanum commersonii TaxID=4109 RepID=A0A9J5ZF40_SOLCO|nr:hypothetical protein H5410_021737 [Solanum commersonii]